LSNWISMWGLHNFTGGDGASPMAALILSGTTLLGTVNNGGPASIGAVFALQTDGTGFTNLHFFTASAGGAATNTDGANPGNASLTLANDTLYGTTFLGSSSGNGTVFKLSVDGTGFVVLHSFSDAVNPYFTNWDGTHPANGVILSRRMLYGTANSGGSGGSGTVFTLGTDGTGFTTLYQFTGIPPMPATSVNSDGSGPGGLFPLANLLYGTAVVGGSGYGTIFSVSCPPHLTIAPRAENMVFTWEPTATGFRLQYSTDLSVWTTLGDAAVLVSGHNTIVIGPGTNAPGTLRFYRLAH
jgi:uncharacterized repeat protein (TIGR03803 family)